MLRFGSFTLQKNFSMLSLIFIEVVRAMVIQGFNVRFCFLFEIVVTEQKVLSSFSIVCRKIWNEVFVSLLPIARVLLQSTLPSAIRIFFRFLVVYFLLKIFLVVGLSEVSFNENEWCKMIQNRGCYVSRWNTFGDIFVKNIIN